MGHEGRYRGEQRKAAQLTAAYGASLRGLEDQESWGKITGTRNDSCAPEWQDRRNLKHTHRDVKPPQGKYLFLSDL